MKIMHEHIDFPLRTAVKVKWRHMPHFTYPWHFHSEFEILYTIEGSGTSFVADNIEQFTSGDLALIGSNLPHFWRSDEKYYTEEGGEKINYIVIQFPGDIFRDSLYEFPEFNIIRQLLERASRGIRFLSPFSEKAGEYIKETANSQGFERILRLLKLLYEMAKTDQYRLLAGELYNKQSHDFRDDRLTKVLHFLNTGYLDEISLEDMAIMANLHPSAFCRYFKSKTGKTLTEYVNDMRISYACKLILEGKMSVSQICYESGFNNLSNFNRIFKRHTGLTPTKYFYNFHKGIK
jgi:AraC-like DNA-binding protein